MPHPWRQHDRLRATRQASHVTVAEAMHAPMYGPLTVVCYIASVDHQTHSHAACWQTAQQNFADYVGMLWNGINGVA